LDPSFVYPKTLIYKFCLTNIFLDKEILVDENILDPKLQIFKTQNILGPNLIFVDISMAILGNYKDKFDT